MYIIVIGIKGNRCRYIYTSIIHLLITCHLLVSIDDVVSLADVGRAMGWDRSRVVEAKRSHGVSGLDSMCSSVEYLMLLGITSNRLSPVS